MIGKLRGKIDTVAEDFVIIDVNGVGYEVHCSSRVLASLSMQEGEATLAIETHVREDMIRLYGFENEGERQWFRLLQSVQGVGARVALAILSTLSITDIANAIALQDKAMVARAPHVGPKLAVRIVTELKDKAPALSAAGMVLPKGSAPQPMPKGAAANSAEAISALVNLGYQPAQASVAVATAFRELGAEAKTEALIRRGLKELAR